VGNEQKLYHVTTQHALELYVIMKTVQLNEKNMALSIIINLILPFRLRIKVHIYKN